MARKSMIEKSKRKQRFGVREYNRCPICGRSRGYMRRFNMCRICFRDLSNTGQIPGVIKSSW